MGLKGAPAFFQHVIASHVLGKWMYKIVELYIDDVIANARSQQQLIDNLRCIFKEFRRCRIYLNPDKCKFGMTSVEYVGRLIDEHGLHFTTEKRQEVLNIDPLQ